MNSCFSFQTHLDTCLYESVPCPNRCSAHLLRFNVDDHIEYLCPKRRVVCDFCSQEFPGDYMDQVCWVAKRIQVWYSVKLDLRYWSLYQPYAVLHCARRLSICMSCNSQQIKRLNSITFERNFLVCASFCAYKVFFHWSCLYVLMHTQKEKEYLSFTF